MKFFVTGATGFIGTPLTKELLANGHQVVGLARSKESAKKLKDLGADVVEGTLKDTQILAEAAGKADGVLHLGFIHDFANFEASMDVDEAATVAMLDALVGTSKIFIYTAGTLTIANDTPADEDFEADLSKTMKRARTEVLALSYAPKGVKVSVVRLAPTVHGAGDKAFIPAILGAFKEHKCAYYPDDGSNVWPAVHRDDAATLFRLVAEKGLTGVTLHGVAEGGVKTKDIAETYAKLTGIPVESIPKEKLSEKLGPFYGRLFTINNPVLSSRTKSITGWSPKHVGLLEDIGKSYL